MKKLIYILIFCVSSSFAFAQGEHRYRQEIFSSVHRTENVVYGYNATWLGLLTPYQEALSQPLVMDIYEPVGDDVNNRPLIIFFHSGNFLPYPDNQSVDGTLRDSSVVAFCTRMAKCGYVVASADYRLGWNPYMLDDDQRRFGIINAAYRGVQDARTCIRYFRASAETGGNPFRICADRIALFGDDTGGYIATHASALQQYEEILEDDELWTDQGGGHFEPMVIDSINGDVEGKSFGINSTGNPPFPSGDTLCYPNLTEISSSFRVAVNLAGAVAYRPWIDPGEPPIISIATPYDNTTPYYCGDVFLPRTDFYVIRVCGADSIASSEEETGNNNIFDHVADYFVDDFQRSVEAVALSRNGGSNCLLPVIGDTTTDINPWDFWSLENSGHDTAIVYNPHMSKEKAYRYMDTILAYVLPRLWIAMDLGPGVEDGCVTATPPPVTDIPGLKLLPNPATTEVLINSPSDKIIREVRLLNAAGSLVFQQKNIDNNEYRLNVSGWLPGIYIAQLRFDEGITARKVIIH